MSTWHWYPKATEFATEWGIPTEVVEAAAGNPTRTSLNEDSGSDGYVIEDRRRGDVTAVVGLREEQPSILYVKVHTHQDYGPERGANQGGGNAPKTMRGVKARIIAEGYRVVPASHGDKVMTRDGAFVCSLPTTPSDHRTPMNCWAVFRRARDRVALAERIAAGDLLVEAS